MRAWLLVCVLALAACGSEPPKSATAAAGDDALPATSGSTASSPSDAGKAAIDELVGSCTRLSLDPIVEMTGRFDLGDFANIGKMIAPNERFRAVVTPLRPRPSTDRKQALADLEEIYRSGQRIRPRSTDTARVGDGGFLTTIKPEEADPRGFTFTTSTVSYGAGGKLAIELDCSDFSIVGINWIAFPTT